MAVVNFDLLHPHSPTLQRRRQDDNARRLSSTDDVLDCRLKKPSRLNRVFNTRHIEGSLTSSSIRHRVVFLIAAFFLVAFLRSKVAYFRSGSVSSYFDHDNLPGSRKLFPGSRRTDALIRAARRQRSASNLFDGRPSGKQNFSDAPPFTFCPTAGPEDELSGVYGRAAIMRTRTHVGSSERVRKVIQRAISGLPITIGVLGGSVSSCQGLDPTPSHPLGSPIGPNCYPHRVFDWLNDVFPNPSNELTNGALRRTGTSYYGYCSDLHLPDRVDLVVVEFDTEDPHDPTTLATTDLLVRSLLLRPDQPAVIILGHFSPQVQGEFGFAGPEIWHAAVSQFYDIVHLSVKGLMYEEYLKSPQKVQRNFYIDPILPNAKGHELLADTLISFLESEICTVWDNLAFEFELGLLAGGPASSPGLDRDPGALLSGQVHPNNAPPKSNPLKPHPASQRATYLGIPPFRISDKPHTLASFREIKPNCASANDLVYPLPISVFADSGWLPMVPVAGDDEERHYWYTEEAGALVKIPIMCGAGDIAVHYLRGPARDGWGTVLCWVDDNIGGAVELKGDWERDYELATVTQVDQGVAEGAHYIVCEMQGEITDKARFKLYGVFST